MKTYSCGPYKQSFSQHLGYQILGWQWTGKWNNVKRSSCNLISDAIPESARRDPHVTRKFQLCWTGHLPNTNQKYYCWSQIPIVTLLDSYMNTANNKACELKKKCILVWQITQLDMTSHMQQKKLSTLHNTSFRIHLMFLSALVVSQMLVIKAIMWCSFTDAVVQWVHVTSNDTF